VIKAVIDRLKTGSIQNVIPFGNSDTVPPPPYVCVKPEPGPTYDRLNLRIIVHREQGEQILLEKYIYEELSKLLNLSVWLEKVDGGKFRVMSNGDWFGPYVEESDKSLVMERMFYVPKRL
jgi:hypothetical protein